MNPGVSAIQQALLLQRHPELLFELQQAPLPEGMATLIRLASDEGGFRDALADESGVDAAQLQHAAAAYLRSMCLFPGSLGLRVLALNEAHDMRLAKDHHRLLIKWLHPDRNPLNELLAERVNQAWSQLKVKRPVVPVAVAADAWPVQGRRGLPKSRFAWFLGGLAALSALLLLLSLLPEQEVYDSGVNADTALGATEPDSAEEEASTALAALGRLAWVEPASGVATAEMPAKPAPARSADTEQPVPKSASSRLGSRKDTYPPATMMQTPVAAMAGPMPMRDELATKPLPAAATIEAKQLDAMPRAEPPRQQAAALSDAKALLPQFISRYRQGDLERFMALFSRDARNKRGDREAIAEDYGQLFSGSQRRELEFSQLQWHQDGGDIILRARYRSKVRLEGAMLAVINKGKVELVLVEEDGAVRIQRIRIGE